MICPIHAVRTSVFNKEVVDGVLAILNTRASGETFSLTPALETLNDIVPGMNATSAIQPAELDRGRITGTAFILATS